MLWALSPGSLVLDQLLLFDLCYVLRKDSGMWKVKRACVTSACASRPFQHLRKHASNSVGNQAMGLQVVTSQLTGSDCRNVQCTLVTLRQTYVCTTLVA